VGHHDAKELHHSGLHALWNLGDLGAKRRHDHDRVVSHADSVEQLVCCVAHALAAVGQAVEQRHQNGPKAACTMAWAKLHDRPQQREHLPSHALVRITSMCHCQVQEQLDHCSGHASPTCCALGGPTPQSLMHGFESAQPRAPVLVFRHIAQELGSKNDAHFGPSACSEGVRCGT